ncbi:hypothetical protein LQL77_30410 [Rhodococcus cerastii]|nr:hypothetical protein [Rhodococcus cerastii]
MRTLTIALCAAALSSSILGVGVAAAAPASSAAGSIAASPEAQSPPQGSATFKEITVDGNQAGKPTFIAEGMRCPTSHPYLVLDDAGSRNDSPFFRNVTYRLFDGQRIRFGEYIIPLTGASGNYIGANVRIHAVTEKYSPIYGHGGITLTCANTPEAAHQNWK